MADKRPSETGARRENCQGDKRAKTTKTEANSCIIVNDKLMTDSKESLIFILLTFSNYCQTMLE